MKVALIIATIGLASCAPAPKADPEAFFPLGAIALPALTNSALIDGLLLGKVAFLKAAILANLLLGASSGDEAADDGAYGAPVEEYGAPVDSYGAPAVEYAEPAPSYEQPQYEEPAAPQYSAPEYSAPAVEYAEPAPSYQQPDTYGAPQADPLPSYGAPAYYKF